MMHYFSSLAPVNKQLIKFSIIGFAAVGVDLVVYYVLLNLLPEAREDALTVETIAKSVSFLCGMSVTYTFNKIWTWKHRNKSRIRLLKFTALYGSSLLINVGTNTFMLYALHHLAALEALPHKYFLAFCSATFVSASVNFLGQKFWVFDPGAKHNR